MDVNKVWLSFSSVFLAFVFVFGNSLRNMYESVIFLFVMHPYDVGDALFINSDWCSVEEIALQYTQVSHTCCCIACMCQATYVSIRGDSGDNACKAHHAEELAFLTLHAERTNFAFMSAAGTIYHYY